MSNGEQHKNQIQSTRFSSTNNHQINNGNVARYIAIQCSYISMILQWQFSIIISNGFVDLFTLGDHMAWNQPR